MTAIPLPRQAWSESAGRRIVAQRAGGRCEGCGQAGALQWSHRIAAGRGGTWAPTNGLHLDLRCHQWAHAEPLLARAIGWHLATGLHPADEPAWRLAPTAGWWLLDDEGLVETITAAGLPDRPALPDWVVESAALMDPWW